MRPISHLVVSISAGVGIWFFAKSLYAGLVCFISSILIDIDHIIEYIIHRGWRNLTLSKVCQACEQTTRQEGDYRFPKLYLIFHSAEVAILFWAVSLYIKNIYFIAIAFGYSIHLVMDCIANPMYIYSYFVTWRVINGFDPTLLFRK